MVEFDPWSSVLVQQKVRWCLLSPEFVSEVQLFSMFFKMVPGSFSGHEKTCVYYSARALLGC